MSRSTSEAPCREIRLLHATRGRLRVHLPGRTDAETAILERELRRMSGVRTATMNGVTRNLLVVFDAWRASAAQILEAVRTSLGKTAVGVAAGRRSAGRSAVPTGKTSSLPARRAAKPVERQVAAVSLGETVGRLAGLSAPAHCEECERRAERRFRLTRQTLRSSLGEPIASLVLGLVSICRFAFALSRVRSPLDLVDVSSDARSMVATLRVLRTA